MKKFLLLLFSLLFFNGAVCQQINFTEIAQDWQFYPRDEQDSSNVIVSAEVYSGSYSTVSMKIFKDSTLFKTIEGDLVNLDSVQTFSISGKIHSELAEYSFQVFLDTTLVAERSHIVSGDCYIINGQSNALAIDYDDKANYQSQWFRSYGNSTSNEADCLADSLWGLAQGNNHFSHAAVGVWGMRLGQLIIENNQVPVCIINGASSGSSIDHHFRNDSDPDDTSTNFGRQLYRLNRAKLTKHVKAVFWNQGESDTGPTYSQYKSNFATLYEDWITEYSDLKKIYLYQIRPGATGGSNDQLLREYQRQIGEEYGDVEIMATVGLPGHDGLHYHYDGYIKMAEWVYPLLARDFYGLMDTLDIQAPSIKKVFYKKEAKELVLLFNNRSGLTWPDDTLGHALKDYFYCDGDYDIIHSGRANKDSVILTLNGYNYFSKITYLPTKNYHDEQKIYAGPWLKNSRGISALSFANISIENGQENLKVVSPDGGEIFEPASQISIEWEFSNVNQIKIEYISNDSSGWQLIADNIDAGLKSYVWQAPELSSSTCKIRISDGADNTVADESNNFFSILNKSIDLLSPNGGEILHPDSTFRISWSTNYAQSVTLIYTVDNELSWKAVQLNYDASSGYFDWKVPNVESQECKIKIWDYSDRDIFDISDSVFTISMITEIKEVKEHSGPGKFQLKQNYPNPFNPNTIITYQLKTKSNVQLIIYDISGRKIRTWTDNQQNAGQYSVTFDASGLASGIYIYKLQTGSFVQSRKMLLLR